MNLKEQRAALLKSATDIVDNAKTQNRDITATESEKIKTITAEIKGVDAKLAESAKSAAILKSLESIDGDDSGMDAVLGQSKGFTLTRQSFVKAGAKIAENSMLSARSKGVSTVLPGATLEAPILHDGIVALNRETNSFLELFKASLIDGRHYSYVRQSGRVNNSAIVAPGETKPTSSSSIELVKGETKVIAHLSNPIDEFLLRDITGLSAVITNDLVHGLYETLESQALNGAGPHASNPDELLGIMNTTGVLNQAFATDALTTIRKALTLVRLTGSDPSAIVLHPNTWESLELDRTNDGVGGYLLQSTGTPIDAAKRTLWGTQVVQSSVIAEDTALVLDPNAAEVLISKPGIMNVWHVGGDEFLKNQIRARSEMRAELTVLKPEAICVATIQA